MSLKAFIRLVKTSYKALNTLFARACALYTAVRLDWRWQRRNTRPSVKNQRTPRVKTLPNRELPEAILKPNTSMLPAFDDTAA